MPDPDDRDPDRPSDNSRFQQKDLEKTVIALPLIEEMKKVEEGTSANADNLLDVIIDANLDYTLGRQGARTQIIKMVEAITKKHDGEGVHRRKSEGSQQYVFARLSPDSIRKLARRDDRATSRADRCIYKIWFDHEIHMFLNRSISTVKADAARNTFGALGNGIVWAVIDSGIDGSHPHFEMHKTLELAKPLYHRDYSSLDTGDVRATEKGDASALVDENGHGTHVAGIIAGEAVAEEPTAGRKVEALLSRRVDDKREERPEVVELPRISGMAPQAKLLSLRVFDARGKGATSNIIAALEYIQECNSYGRRLLIHGVNLSVGYDFEPKWFACGQSPLCIEVNRLVRSGVVVVAAAGNTGYGAPAVMGSGPPGAGLGMSINDPGNADSAITVGSTHRDMPHVYGVSYFSSKGPTADGRDKPDLVAPGERIVSCRSAKPNDPSPAGTARYAEMSGTSQAAPHVSGAIAAFLSIRQEFIGQPERVKEIFKGGATSLGRGAAFQGSGMLDLMRSIQSV
jgi:subtilisin family serine protease